MARLPTVGGDSGNWGTVLNEYLTTAHNADGTLKLDVQTIADLKAIDVATLTDKQQALVAGYSAAGDGGGGAFYYDQAASDADNGGTIFQPDAGAGRWKRVWDGAQANVAWFGVFPSVSVNQTSSLQVAIDMLSADNVLIQINHGTYRVRNLLIRANTRLLGAGRATVLKLLDDSVEGDYVLKCASSVSGIDNVYIGHMTVDGNSAQIGLSDVNMHGISIWGGHKNWTIEHIYAQNTCGNGVSVTTTTGNAVPENIRLMNIHCENTLRQSIAIVRANGVTVSDCSGDDNLDLEANSGDLSSLYGVVITNARFESVNVIGRGAEDGGYSANNITATGLLVNAMTVYQTAGASLSGIVCSGQITVSASERVNMTGVVARNVKVMAPNGQTIRRCQFSDFRIDCSEDSVPGLEVINAVDCEFSGFAIKSTGTGGDGVKISNATAQPAGELSFTDFKITHNQYGFYAIPALLDSATIRLSRAVIRNEVTRALYVSTGSAVSYGEFIVSDCEIFGGINMTKFKRASLIDVKIRGNYDVRLTASTDGFIDVDGVTFIRSSAGTPTLDLSNHTTLAGVRIGRVEQFPSGSFTASFTSSTFGSGIKAWINGPVVEATTWASSLADANIKEGSVYHIRGNATNWGYTHNGASWVAKSH